MALKEELARAVQSMPTYRVPAGASIGPLVDELAGRTGVARLVEVHVKRLAVLLGLWRKDDIFWPHGKLE